MRQLGGTVLIMEAVVIGLAIPVAIVLEHLDRAAWPWMSAAACAWRLPSCSAAW